jgi:S-DNA-T family DNA segregation ATPase FtsK/SpoIIIE
MNIRYIKLKNSGVKKISQYNTKNNNDKLAYIVLIIDEMSDIKLNANKELTESIENSLTLVMNKGRAAGILVIGATQRPAASQLNTNIRDRFGTKFSARIKDKRSQEMAGIKGTENLRDGEFLMEYIEDVQKFKAFYIDEINNNKVYENLQNKLTGGVKFDKII